ncbi:hypothetical protein D3C71_1346930 [compost metagenome]
MLGDIGQAGQARQVRAHTFITEGRQPFQVHREQQHQHQPHPEQRRGVGQHGQRGDDGVAPLPHPQRRLRAQADTRQQREREGRQGQQQGGRQVLQNQAGDRRLLAVGIAQVERRDVLQVLPQLHGNGLVQPEFLAQLGDELGIHRAGLTGQDFRRVARRGPYQEEIEERDHQQNQDALDHPVRQELGDLLHSLDSQVSLCVSTTPSAVVTASCTRLFSRVE